MQLSWDEIQANAIKFSKRWENALREKADEQPFIIELIGVFGVADPVKAGERQKEVKVPGASTKWIDYFWKKSSKKSVGALPPHPRAPLRVARGWCTRAFGVRKYADNHLNRQRLGRIFSTGYTL